MIIVFERSLSISEWYSMRVFHFLHPTILNDQQGLVFTCWNSQSLGSPGAWQRPATKENSSMEYQYLTCLNWAFAQLGVGSSPALATNVPEMAYCNWGNHGEMVSWWAGALRGHQCAQVLVDRTILRLLGTTWLCCFGGICAACRIWVCRKMA